VGVFVSAYGQFFMSADTPVIGADRCGTRCGEAPTSGEIQTRNGCEAGYITDPKLCADVGY